MEQQLISQFYNELFLEIWDAASWSDPLYDYSIIALEFHQQIYNIFNNSRDAALHLIDFSVSNFYSYTIDLEKDPTQVFMSKLRREPDVIAVF